MKSLYEVFRERKIEKEIYTTTAYPYFIRTRYDVMDIFTRTGLFRKFPPVAAEDVANEIVDGIRNNRTVVSIPWVSYLYFHFLSMLPVEVKNLFKDVFTK